MTGVPSARAAVHQPADRLGELPHHRRVLRRAEVEAVGDGDRLSTADGDVAVRLGQGQLRAGVRVEQVNRPLQSVASATPRLVSSSIRSMPGVLGLGQHRVAADVAVVLVGHPGLVAEVRRRRPAAAGSRPARSPVVGRASSSRRCAWTRILPVGPGVRALVDRALVRDGPRRLRRQRSRRASRSTSRSSSVTSPITVASTSHLAQISRNGVDIVPVRRQPSSVLATRSSRSPPG